MINVGVMFRNNEKLIDAFFYFLRRSTRGASVTICAIDQASEDRTNELLRKHLTDNDILVKSETNLGCAGGRNLIVKTLYYQNNRYQDVFLLDSDCFIVQHESLLRMQEIKADIVFGKTHSFHDFNEVGMGGMCFCLVRENAFKTIGLFDERYKMFYDDSDFMDRARKHKLSLKPCDKAVAVHVWGETVTHGSEGYRREACLKHDKAIYDRGSIL